MTKACKKCGWTQPRRTWAEIKKGWQKPVNWEEIAVAAPAAFLLGVIVGYAIRGRYHLEKKPKEKS